MSQPFITVLIPAFNAAATIRRAIDSALAQSYQDHEIVVVDDGSLDATSDIVATYDSTKVRLLRLARNQGEGGPLNEGIAVARGELIAFLDADDEWLPDKLDRQVAALRDNPAAVMASCACRFVDAQGRLLREFGMPPPGIDAREVWRALLAASFIAKPCVVARRQALQAVGPFDTRVAVGADQDMWIRLSLAGEVAFVREFLTIVHDTAGSLTKVYASKADKYVLPMIRRHIAAQRHRLSDAEVKGILGTRLTSVGRILYLTGSLRRGATLILQAVFMGHRVRENLWYLAAASPPARAVKKLLRPAAAEAATRGAGAVAAVPRNALLAPAPDQCAPIAPGPPVLLVTVDAEAEFDWDGPFLRTHLNVRNLGQQALAQSIFDRFGVRPIYLVDYAVATQPEGYGPIREFLRSGRCEIGSHLQPWETPPYAEELGARTSFNHNLPAWLQKEKLLRLTEVIVDNFGIQPQSYRAGRYGVGEEIARILQALGYEIEMSVLPGYDLRWRHGPDFRRACSRPYWFGQGRQLLEIPLTSGFAGLLAGSGRPQPFTASLYAALSQPRPAGLHLPGLFARLGLLERITLTPEGRSLRDLKRLTRILLDGGQRVFTFSYHSSALLPGATSYVRSPADLDRLLRTIEEYLHFFMTELGGVSMTPAELRATLHPGPPASPARDTAEMLAQ